MFASILRTSRHLTTEPLRSPFYDTSDHGDFLNYILEVRAALPPASLYKDIAKIEETLGHDRTRRWAPRVIDIDILLACRDEEKPFPLCKPIIECGALNIPHSELANRPFLLDLLMSDFAFPDNFLTELVKRQGSYV